MSGGGGQTDKQAMLQRTQASRGERDVFESRDLNLKLERTREKTLADPGERGGNQKDGGTAASLKTKRQKSKGHRLHQTARSRCSTDCVRQPAGTTGSSILLLQGNLMAHNDAINYSAPISVTSGPTGNRRNGFLPALK